jgi:hypothetical protein
MEYPSFLQTRTGDRGIKPLAAIFQPGDLFKP